jgi:hypothetical protein
LDILLPHSKSIALGWKRCTRTVKQTNNQPLACAAYLSQLILNLISFFKGGGSHEDSRKEPRFIPKDTPNSNEKVIF